MNILILNWRDIKHPLAGGAEISTHEHAKGWVKSGHKVTIFASHFPSALHSEEINGVTVVRRGSHYTVHFFAFLYYLTTARRTADLIVDEFHFIPFFTPLYVRRKILAFIHETAEEIWFKNTSFPINIFGYVLEPLFFLFYRTIQFMTVSESTKRDLLKFHIPAKNIAVIPNGHKRVKIYAKKSKHPVIMYLGRISTDKGVRDGILAFSNIRKRIPDGTLWIVGKEEHDGQKRDLLVLMRALHIENAVKFFGFVSEATKYELLGQSWVLLHPSVKEGWGLTVIEAASQRTPAVAYKTAGLSDSIVHGKTGLLVSKAVPERLADAVVHLCTNKNEYEKMASQARLWSQKFNWNTSTQKSLALIENLI